ncbi:HNH endonuclease [Brevibacterium litoralis]|uniref:HNH endonuclease n=1 Tax=Brevibacterium litoralis TaxID=3138935 RepID=UPI0032F013FC
MKTLVLNAGYEPMSIVSFRRAVVLVLAGKATVLAAEEGARVRSATLSMEQPSVILLRRYVRPPRDRSVALSRRGVLRRDRHRCAYCDGHATTVDHVLPRSRGGANTWENLVACCRTCNNRKGDRTPEEIGWELRFTPTRPRTGNFWLRDVDAPVEQWRPFLSYATAA